MRQREGASCQEEARLGFKPRQSSHCLWVIARAMLGRGGATLSRLGTGPRVPLPGKLWSPPECQPAVLTVAARWQGRPGGGGRCGPEQEKEHPPTGGAALTRPPTSSSPEKSAVRGLLWLRRVRLRWRPRPGSRARPSWQWERSRSSPWPRVCSPEAESAWDGRVGAGGQEGTGATASSPRQTTRAVAGASWVSLLRFSPSPQSLLHLVARPTFQNANQSFPLAENSLPSHCAEKKSWPLGLAQGSDDHLNLASLLSKGCPMFLKHRKHIWPQGLCTSSSPCRVCTCQ